MPLLYVVSYVIPITVLRNQQKKCNLRDIALIAKKTKVNIVCNSFERKINFQTALILAFEVIEQLFIALFFHF